MDNIMALQQFKQALQRRFPGRSTAKHYESDVRLFQSFCPKLWAEGGLYAKLYHTQFRAIHQANGGAKAEVLA